MARTGRAGLGVFIKLIGGLVVLYGLSQALGALSMAGSIEGDGLMSLIIMGGVLLLLLGGGIVLVGRWLGGAAQSTRTRDETVDHAASIREFQKSQGGQDR